MLTCSGVFRGVDMERCPSPSGRPEIFSACNNNIIYGDNNGLVVCGSNSKQNYTHIHLKATALASHPCPYRIPSSSLCITCIYSGTSPSHVSSIFTPCMLCFQVQRT